MPQRTVNERQREVLAWIVDGCPHRESPDTTYKTVAVALQGRRLVTISRKGGVWRAEATDAGRFFVEHGVFPEDHWIPPAAPRRSKRATAAGPVGQQAPENDTNARPAGPQGKASINPTDVDPAPPSCPEVTAREPAPIRVPSRMPSRPHPAVKAIQVGNSLDGLSTLLRQRALRILQGLATESERRAYTVAERRGRLQITIRGHSETVDLREPSTRTPHVPTTTELAAQAKHSWMRPPQWDVRPSGRLRAVVRHRDLVEPKPRKDGTMAWVLEDRLDHVLALVEEAVEMAEQRQRRREEEAQAKRQRWEAARAQAVVDFQEHRRIEAMQDQVDRWEEVTRIESFLEAFDDHLATLTNAQDIQDAVEWRRWIAAYVGNRSPFSTPLRTPAHVQPSPQDLAPFMRGMSPHSP